MMSDYFIIKTIDFPPTSFRSLWCGQVSSSNIVARFLNTTGNEVWITIRDLWHHKVIALLLISNVFIPQM